MGTKLITTDKFGFRLAIFSDMEGGKRGMLARLNVAFIGSNLATRRHYCRVLLYQRRTRRARSVFQRLAPPTSVSIFNGICSG
jgi:hypothetical protein